MNFEYQNFKNKILNSLRLNPSADRIEFYYPVERKKVVTFDRRNRKNDFESYVIDFLANVSLTYTIRDFRYSLVEIYYVNRPTFSFFLENSVVDTNIDCETMEAFLENIKKGGLIHMNDYDAKRYAMLQFGMNDPATKFIFHFRPNYCGYITYVFNKKDNPDTFPKQWLIFLQGYH